MSTITVESIPPIGHREAMQMAVPACDRMLDLLAALEPDEWERPTDCEGWTVRDIAAHLDGSACFSASLREQRRQQKAADRQSREEGIPWIDAWGGRHVSERDGWSPERIVEALRRNLPRARRGRKRIPGLVRSAVKLPIEEPLNRKVPLGYIIGPVLNRDLWLHRLDVCRATGRDFEQTADHDGRIVADVVRDWAAEHGQPFTLTLHGPAGGVFRHGSGGDELALDTPEFCRIISGRAEGEGLLKTQVLF